MMQFPGLFVLGFVVVSCASLPLAPSKAIGAAAAPRSASLLRTSRRAEVAHTVAAGVDTYYVVDLLDQIFTDTRQEAADAEARRHDEVSRLTAAMARAPSSADRVLLEQAVQFSEEEGMEARNAQSTALHFYHTVKAALGARGSVPSCEFLTCAVNEACALNARGAAECRCVPGFARHGQGACEPILFFAAQPIPVPHEPGSSVAVADVSVATYAHNHIIVAFRDTLAGNRGFLMAGLAGIDSISWGPVQAFSGQTPSFGTELVALPTGRFVVSFRDNAQGAIGHLVGGQVVSGQAVLSPSQQFSRHQSQRTRLVPLAQSRVACVYAGQVADLSGDAQQYFGGVGLLQVGDGGAVHVLGRYRFAELEVSYLTVALLSASDNSASFVIGYRGIHAEAVAEGAPSQELSAILVRLDGQELAIAADPLELERDVPNILSRSVALVSKNVFSYTYQCATQETTKTVLIRVDPMTNHMSLLREPQVISAGTVSFINAISVPYGPAAPRTFSYFQSPGRGSEASVCRVAQGGTLSSCEVLQWTGGTVVSSVDAQRLEVEGGQGRLLFVFADQDGWPFWQFLGTSDS